MTIKRRCFEQMAAAFAEVSDGGRLPAPARNIAYALRRLTGLGDDLNLNYVLKGAGNTGLIDQYLVAHPGETITWDVIRDARGSLVDRDGRSVALGTTEVRRYIDAVEHHDPANYLQQFSLRYPKAGPVDSYGGVLYIEKEGFREIIAADGIQRRRDLAVVSSKGYSVRAARRLLDWLDSLDLPVLVAHDLDRNGIGIADLILAEVDRAIDIGLRWEDYTEDRWGLAAATEAVTYPSDPRANLIERGATDDEIDLLCSHQGADGRWAGRRVELNALTGTQFITWLESKLDTHGIGKVVPDADVMETAYRRAWGLEMINREIAERVDGDEAELPDDLDTWHDLVTAVTERLEEASHRAWDEVLADLVGEALDERGD